MANNKAFKVKNGIQAGRYLLSNGTETAGSEGYSLAGASYDSVSFSVAGQETNPYDIFFKPDGTKMYVIGSASDTVREYNLSTAWDISSASYLQGFSVLTQEATPLGLFFKPDGTKMYVTGQNGDDVNEYTLSTAWDVTSASYVQLFSVAAQDTGPNSIFFKPDGTSMYIVGLSDSIHEYSLSTAWDVSSSSFVQSFDLSVIDTAPRGFFFKSDGMQLFVVGASGNIIFDYTLTTAWDISTLSYVSSFSVASETTNPSGIFFKSDGTKMYISDILNDSVGQYSTVSYTQTLDLSTGTTFAFTPSGATTVSFTNPPASGKALAFSVTVGSGTDSITWPSSVKWEGGAAPTRYDEKDLFVFITTDGGTTYYGKKAAEALA